MQARNDGLNIYNTIGEIMKRGLVLSCRSIVLAGVLLVAVGAAPLFGAETYYVAGEGENQALNVRSGPGIEYSVVSRLSRGMPVVVHERWGVWARVAPVNQGTSEGWVLQRYLTATQPGHSQPSLEMDRDQEERRFKRLQRKDIIRVKRSGVPGVLHLSMSPLVWYRLTVDQQETFLRRARTYYGGSVVEVRDRRNDALLARLSAGNRLELIPFPERVSDAPNDGTAASFPPSVPAPENARPGQ